MPDFLFCRPRGVDFPFLGNVLDNTYIREPELFKRFADIFYLFYHRAMAEHPSALVKRAESVRDDLMRLSEVDCHQVGAFLPEAPGYDIASFYFHIAVCGPSDV